ncbi:MAG: hypothetical protein U5P10_06955 [Spirochaetia bacterium]|nr:hypothetical protein [Spirochaetia bacterium]
MNSRQKLICIIFISLPGLCFSPVAALAQDISYYRSNSLGMALEEISPRRLDDHPFVLRRSSNKTRVDELLYKDGQEYQRAEYEWKNDVKYARFYENGALIGESIEQAGRLQEERIITPRAVERRVYEWEKGQLRGVRVIQDEKEWTEEYIRGSDGALQQVLRAEHKNGARIAGIYSGSQREKSQTQWHFTEDGWSYFFYINYEELNHEENEQQVTEKYRDGALTYRKEAIRKEDGRVVEEQFFEQEKRIHTVFSDEGRKLYSSIETPEGTIREEYTYQNGRLSELQRKGPEMEERILYIPGEGSQLDETIFRNGKLQKEVFYHEEERKTEVLYRNGEALARIEYKGEEVLNRSSLLQDNQ